METKDYIILAIVLLGFLFITKCNNDNSVSEEFMEKILNRELALVDSISATKERLYLQTMEQMSAQLELKTTNSVVNNYLAKPTEFTSRDTSDCYHIIKEVNTCQGLLTSLQFSSNKANETNLGLISGYKTLTNRQDSLIAVKDEKISYLKPKGKLFITATFGGGVPGFNEFSPGLMYVGKDKWAFGAGYNTLEHFKPADQRMPFKFTLSRKILPRK